MEESIILIPAFNAAVSLSELLRRIERTIPRERIVVVDDGSTDQTKAIAAREGVHLLSHDRNYGKGRALRTGFQYILSATQCTNIVTMDADLQHRPEEIASFFDLHNSEGFDMLIGYRPRWGTSMPFERRLSNAITSFLVSARTGVRIKDSQCGYRLIARRVLESVQTTSDGYEAETELLIKAALQGFSIGFVPVTTIYAGEHSSMTNTKTTIRFLETLFTDY
jgi:glycosyltransferase involved in cell wall biosynthesis